MILVKNRRVTVEDGKIGICKAFDCRLREAHQPALRDSAVGTIDVYRQVRSPIFNIDYIVLRKLCSNSDETVREYLLYGRPECDTMLTEGKIYCALNFHHGEGTFGGRSHDLWRHS